ncbi:MAG TPA: helix-turn-helix domain-containing protein [Caulobacteraceae bacterium]|jgi:transcriptional regulator with XRE-family HTH domain|nr:helix-turn-helix domain-containing protein [Caulobacteraceae bacterium]
MESRYQRLGGAIVRARMGLGLTNQRDLALRLNISQQTVSRWEAGTHRPRLEQVGDLAAALKLKTGDVSRMAGYAAVPTVGAVQPFPIEHLDPVTFEYFTADVVQRSHRDAEVRRAGSSGHKQDGLDVLAVLPGGRRIGFQCKRAAKFGPAEVRRAFEACTAEADEKILVLSRVASPQTAEAVSRAHGWSLWDSDDLSRIIRALPMHDQEQLVDLYWPGQRQALLGRAEPGPWLSADDFFRPYDGREKPFSHSWGLYGRELEQDQLLKAIAAPGPLTLLVAPGGMGKSRLLKTVAQSVAVAEPATLLRFLSHTATLTPQSLEDLGPGPKILVVDDAHDRDGLGILFEFASDPARLMKLVLATRPYAKDRILGEAAVYGVSTSTPIPLDRLSKLRLTDLAREVLGQFGAPKEWAEPIVHASGDSPLFVAMVSRVIALEQVALESARTNDDVRQYIQGKFARVMEGDLAVRGEEHVHRAVLEVLAVVQPFNLDDAQVRDLIVEVRDLDKDQVSRTLKVLVDGGVAFKRGPSCRLMPDVLGDFLIERACLDSQGALSPFAIRLLEAMPTSVLKNALVNLGRLDWRRSVGDTANSRLLDAVWRSFDDIVENWDPRLDAIKAVALYQPHQALDFITRLAQRGQRLAVFDEIARNIAYSGSLFDEILTLLWDLAHGDPDKDKPGHGNPFKVLTDLGEINQHNPHGFAETIAEYGLKLTEDEDNWPSAPTPLDLLKPIMSVEGIHTEAVGHNISMSPFYVNYDFVQPWRQKVIARAIALLAHANPRVAADAASFFDSALQTPIGAFNSGPPDGLREALNAEFPKTLKSLARALKAGIHPVAALGLAKSTYWHAEHGVGPVKTAARAVMKALPTDLRFRTLTALADGWGQIYVPIVDANTWQFDLEAWLQGIADAIDVELPEPEARCAYIETALEDLSRAGRAANSGHMLIGALARSDLGFARALLTDAMAHPGGLLRQYSALALNTLLQNSESEGRLLARRLLASEDDELIGAVAAGYGALGRQPNREDVEILKSVLASTTPFVVSRAITALFQWRGVDPRVKLDLLLSANLGNARLADDLAMVLRAGEKDLWEIFGRADTDRVLAALEPIPQLSGHWINELLAMLSYKFPDETANFFMRRAEAAAAADSYEIRPANYGPYSQKRLRFLETSAGVASLGRVWTWLTQNGDRGHVFEYAASSIFEAMFAFDDQALVNFFGPILPKATSSSLRQLAGLLRRARPTFVFSQTAFVLSFLRRCQTVDPGLVEHAIIQLYASATSGVRSGQAGKPMPKDLQDVAQADLVLAKLSRLDPAHRLYTIIKASAQRSIDETLEASKLLEEE